MKQIILSDVPAWRLALGVTSDSANISGNLTETGVQARVYSNFLASGLSGELTQTGVQLNSKINSLSGHGENFYVKKLGDENITGIKTFVTTGLNIAGEIVLTGIRAGTNVTVQDHGDGTFTVNSTAAGPGGDGISTGNADLRYVSQTGINFISGNKVFFHNPALVPPAQDLTITITGEGATTYGGLSVNGYVGFFGGVQRIYYGNDASVRANSILSTNFVNRTLLSSDADVTLNWSSQRLISSADALPSLDWSGKWLLNSSSEIVANWENRTLSGEWNIERLRTPTLQKSIYLESPTTGDNGICLFQSERTYTPTRIVHVALGTSPIVAWRLLSTTDRSSTTGLLIATGLCNNTTTGLLHTSFTNSISGNNFLIYRTDFTGGAVRNLSLTLNYY